MLKLPRAAEREYLAAYGIVAVYVATLPSDGALVGFSRDLLHSLIAIRRKHRGGHISCAYWVKDRTEARLITRQVNDDLAFTQHDARTAQRRIENVAAHMGIAITDHATVLMRTRSAVAYIEDKIVQAHASGELQWFNSGYRAWRLEAKRHGRGMSYSEAKARLRQKIFRQVLLGEGQTCSQELFPPLPGIDFRVPG
jgi:hypothetical protein